ncbi:MAG: hypothetical protein ACRBFS_07730 [Aureispira sp.]
MEKETASQGTEATGAPFDVQAILGIVKDYSIEILKFSWLIGICAFLLGTYMRNQKLESPTTYTAPYSFSVNKIATEKQQNIASLFGGSGGNGGAAEGNVNFKRLRELVLTRQIMLRVLFDTISLKHQKPVVEDLLINHYLNLFYYKGPKEGDAAQKRFYFQTDSIDPYDRRANYLLKYVHNLIVRNHLTIEASPGGIMHMKVVSVSEDFSYELVHAIYRALDSFYSLESLEQKGRFLEMAEERVKQLRRKLNGAEASYITYVNTHSAEAGGRNNTLIETQFLSTDLKRATQSYFKAVGSRDAAQVAYQEQSETPSISAVDPPLYPLPKVTPSPFLHMVAGGILGAFMAFLLVVGQKFVRDYLRNKKAAEQAEINNK